MHYHLLVINDGSDFCAEWKSCPLFFHGIREYHLITLIELDKLRGRVSRRGEGQVDPLQCSNHVLFQLNIHLVVLLLPWFCLRIYCPIKFCLVLYFVQLTTPYLKQFHLINCTSAFPYVLQPYCTTYSTSFTWQDITLSPPCFIGLWFTNPPPRYFRIFRIRIFLTYLMFFLDIFILQHMKSAHLVRMCSSLCSDFAPPFHRPGFVFNLRAISHSLYTSIQYIIRIAYSFTNIHWYHLSLIKIKILTHIQFLPDIFI